MKVNGLEWTPIGVYERGGHACGNLFGEKRESMKYQISKSIGLGKSATINKHMKAYNDFNVLQMLRLSFSFQIRRL